jgi:hypothetical protein
MAVTYYVALPFIRTDDGTAPGEAQECQSEAAAIRRAEGMSRDPVNAGAVERVDLTPSRFSRARASANMGSEAPQGYRGRYRSYPPGGSIVPSTMPITPYLEQRRA